MKLKKMFVRTATVCATSTLLCGAITPLQQAIAQEIQKPNFVTIILDDMGYSDLGVFGGEVKTPNLDQLASDGVILTNFYAASSSSPSRAMLFSGKDNHKAGMGTMRELMELAPRPEIEGQPGYEGVLSLDVLPYPQVLQDNGYYTMMTGKWHMGGDREGEEAYYAINRGFSETRSLLLSGGDNDYLVNTNGMFVTETANEVFGGRVSLYNDNGVETDFSMQPRDVHSTTHFTNEAIKMLDNRDPTKPFYLNMSYLAPHMPYGAPKEVTDKYVDIYAVGWDKLREQRLNNLKQLGYVPKAVPLAERPANIKPWDTLSEREKRFEARRMSVYAAELDLVDQNVGRLVQSLKDRGVYENTVFIVYSDNGAGDQAFSHAPPGTTDHNHIDVNTLSEAEFEQLLAELGTSTSFINQTPGWAAVTGIPFRGYKGDTLDGGTRGAAFVHYPQGKAKNVKTNCLYSVMDIAPTLLEMAGTEYPSEYNGKPNEPMDGISMAGLFEGDLVCNPDRWIGFELNGTRAIRKGNWKLGHAKYTGNYLGLYNVWEDPFETNDLAEEKPALYQEMLGLYQQYAEENGVVEVNANYLPDLADPSQTNAKIRGGVSSLTPIGAAPRFNAKGAFSPMRPVNVAGEIRPAAEHQGQPGQIFVLISYTPAGSSEALYFWRTADGFSETPMPFKEGTLPNMADIPIFSGSFPAPANIEVFMGYQPEYGDLVYSSTPIKLTIAE